MRYYGRSIDDPRLSRPYTIVLLNFPLENLSPLFGSSPSRYVGSRHDEDDATGRLWSGSPHENKWENVENEQYCDLSINNSTSS